ncbi:MAG: hypothetical protein CYG59_01745 [Chloroflexi bacterium]|nr:MAG: hypothetical protein CYG59_01745 [Chloroflexota bacterium]
MNTFDFLFAWYNVPFVVALGSCLVLALLQMMGPFGDSDADADGDVDGSGWFEGALDAIGVGRAPLTIVLLAFCGSLGIVGLIINTLIANTLGHYPDIALWLALPTAFVLGLLLTGRLSTAFAQLAPERSSAIGFDQLVGRVGIVVSPAVSLTYGRVQVRDPFGSLHTVFAVIDRGDPVPERREVALVAYDDVRRCFVVRSLEQPHGA